MCRDEIEGWWKVPKKKNLQKDERMIIPSLSLLTHVGHVHCEIMKLNL